MADSKENEAGTGWDLGSDPELTDTSSAEGVYRNRVCGWRAGKTDVCLVRNYSQREVLPLGPLSVHKCQRYALVFLNSQTLRK